MEPTSIRAGDSITWTRDEPNYPPSAGWALAYRLIPTSGSAVDISTTGAGSTYTATLTASATAALAAGRWTLAAHASKGAERATVYSADLQVLPNLATAAAFDPRSANEIELEAARAAWSGGRKSYTVGDRQVVFHDAPEMLVRIRWLEQKVAEETYLKAVGAGQEAAPPGRVMYRSA
jgi:hypothetical protein